MDLIILGGGGKTNVEFVLHLCDDVALRLATVGAEDSTLGLKIIGIVGLVISGLGFGFLAKGEELEVQLISWT